MIQTNTQFTKSVSINKNREGIQWLIQLKFESYVGEEINFSVLIITIIESCLNNLYTFNQD